jgi:glycosyltransferase involved in cell wall biosynthesis
MTQPPFGRDADAASAPPRTARAAIVVPCFNEAARLDGPRFVAFARAHPGIDFVLVDDGSTDGTPRRLDEIAAQEPSRFGVLRLGENRGKGEAVRRGLCAALERDPTYAGYWDADLATPLEEIPRFVAILESRPELELVLGSRVQLLGRTRIRSPMRHLGGRLFALFAARTLGLPVHDTQCGAKLLRVSPPLRALLDEPFETGWVFDVELLARLVSARRAEGREDPSGSVYEEPVLRWHDAPGSKVRSGDFLRAVWQLVRIRRRYPAARGLPSRPHATG